MKSKYSTLIGTIIVFILTFGMVGVALAAPAAGVTLGGAGDVFIGASPIAMSVTFDNTATLPTDPDEIGYGPFIDVYFPANGADGVASLPLDGLDYIAGSATYLGLAVTEVVLTFPAAPLGGICGPTESYVDHPFALDSFHNPIQVCGTPNDTLVVFQLPFGSFTPDQPAATINFEASLSNFADLNVPLQVYARGGYEYGADPLDNPCCDPSIFTDIDGFPYTITDNPVGAVNPILLTLTKTNTPPESEVATGPNFPHTYTVTVEAAPGQTITNLDVFDYVDDNIVITGISAPGASSITLGGLPVAFPAGPVVANGTANRVVVTYPSFSGTVAFDISYYVPLLDASGASIITPNNGATSLTNNTANAVGDWDPLDPRDPSDIATAGDGLCPACPPLVTHENEPMPIQKSVENLTDGTVLDPDGTPSPGDVLEYSYSVQVSDFFALDNADFFDVISDGQRLTGNPILTYTQHGTTYGPNPVALANVQVLEYFTGTLIGPGVAGLPDADVTGEAAGDTVLKIDLSAELALLGLNEILGGCVPTGGTGAGNPNCTTFNAGATTITVNYQTTIQDSFSDEFPSGDSSVDHGDTLDNVVTLEIDTVLNTTNLAPSGVGSTVVDDSGAGVTIAQGLTEKTIYAITEVNTNTTTLNPAGVPEISPDDVVTFRLRYEMPSTDFEDFSLSDFLPLPVLDANEVVVFNDVISNGTNTIGVGVPAAGQAMWGPTGVTDGNVNFRNRLTALGLNLQNGSTVPGITNPGSSIPAICGGTAISSAENFLNFCFGDFDDPANVDSYIDILFSVTVSDDPYADGLFLTNFARGGTGSTNAADANSDEIVMFELREPILLIRKGISDSTNPNETFETEAGAPETPNPALDLAGDAALPPFTGSLESGAGGNGEADNGTDANAGGLDAGDTVRYVITIQNTGGSAAFDIRLFDTLPTGLTCNAGTVNLNVTMGDGTPVAYTNIGTASPCDFFTNFDGNALDGIELVDPADGLCQQPTVDPARAVIVITYDLTIDNTVSAGDLLVNTTVVTNFAGTEGGPTHLPDPFNYPFDEAQIEIAGTIEKDLISTSETSSSELEVGIVGDERPVLVGEVVTYRVYTRIPEGTTNNLQFRDNTPNGLQYVTGSARFAFVSNTNGNVTSSDATINAALPWISGNAPTTPTAILPVGAISGGASSGDDLVVSFGNVTNNENDNGAEYIVLEFQMVVNNIAANQDGIFLLNTATLRKNGADLVTSDEDTADVDNDPVALVVIEPIINITKTAIAAASRDAGDTVTYTVTIQNTGNARAFDLNLTDTLSADLNLVSVSTPASPAYYSEASRSVTTGAGGNFNITFTELRPGDTVSYTVTATIMNTALVGEPIDNTAAVTWTSLPGTQGTANATPGASGADNGERNGGGGTNDYTDNDLETITLTVHNATKSIIATSETFTDNSTLPNSGASRVPVAIGEVLRYQLVVDVPEGTSTDLLVNDQLAAGLGLIEDATIEVRALNFFDPSNFDSIDFGAGLEAATLAPVDLHNGTSYVFTTGTYPFNLVDYNSVTNLLTFNLGDIVNNDSDSDVEQIIITFNVVVRNTNATNFSNIIDNSFTVFSDDAVGASELRDTSNIVQLRVQEPLITIAKSVSPLTGDAGDTFTYTLLVSNTGGANRTTAFEVHVTDDLGALTDLDLTAVSAAGATDNSILGFGPGFGFVDVTIPSIPAGGSFTITLTVVLRSTATPNEIITNTSTAIWTSLPATGTPVGVGNPTGSITPGGSGATNGERDHSSAPASPNDYRTTDTADLTVDQVVPVKSIIASSESSTSDTSFPNTGGSNVPVAIGEIVTFQLVVSIPEGTSSDVIMSDILVPGLDYVSGSARVYTNSAGAMTFQPAMGAVPNSSPGAVIATDGDAALPAAVGTIFFDTGTREVQINLGDILNNDSDGDAEQVIVTFQVVVLNSAANNLGTIWSNTFNVRVAGNAPVTSNAVTGIIQEPVLTIDKSINTTLSNPTGVTTFDGGDTVVYDIVVTGGNLANQSTAFDLNVLDGVDANLDLITVAFIGTPVYATTTDNSDYAMPIQAVDVVISELRAGDFITIRVTATVRSSVTIGQIIANTATTTWTSLPGSQGTGNATPGTSGASTGERNGTTAPLTTNDYLATDTVPFTVTGTVNTIKSIDGTSEAHTSDGTADTNADPRPVAVGEVITYRLVVEIPEGTSPDVQVTDTFATNIEYIAGTARVSFSANNAVTGTGSYGINEINPSTIFPAGQISFGAINPRELRFDVGQVINNDNDNAVTTELLIIEFQVVVVNTSDNTIGDIWSNDFEVDLNNDGTDEDVSNEVFNIVQEPVLTIDKSINTTLSNPTGVTTFDGGDTVVYDIVVTGGNAANQSTAFDLQVLDGIDANLDLITVAFIGTPVYATTTDNSDYAMPIQAVDVTISELRPGDFITIRVTATVRSSVTMGQIIANTADVTWTSLPGNQGTANATPGNSGDTNGERNGNTVSENDYVATDVINFTVTGTVDTIKSIDGTSEAHTDDTTTDVSGDERPVAVGEVITYRLVVEVPEGTSPDVQVTDTLSPNIEYIAGTARVSFSANNAFTGTGSYGINEINPSTIFPAGQTSFGVTGPRELRFDVGQVINNDNDDAATTELLIIEFQVVVVNTSDNTLGDIWSNDFEVDLNNDGTDEDASNEVFNIVQEPVLTIDKSINTTLSNPSGVTTFDGGDTVVYDIMVTGGNAANQSTAFDLNVLDGIDVNLDLVSVAFIGTPAYATTADNSDYAMPIQAVDVTISELRPGDFITVRVTTTVRSSVTIAQVIANTAEVTWTSLPGNQGTANATPGNSGDTNGERNGNTISENDYVTDDTVNFSVTGTVDTIKSINGTSEAHTDDTTSDVSGDERPVAIGEVITYRLVVEVPEGTSTDLQITDTLSPNIEYIAGTARVSFSANSAFTGTGSYGTNEPNPSTPFPAGQTSFGLINPRELRFDVGEVINNDNDDAATTELLIIEFQVVVVNTTDNSLGDIWSNAFEVDLNNDGTDEDASNQVFNIVQEPVVTATKAIIGAAPVDALENVTYDIVVTAGNAANQSIAYNLNVLDVLHPDLLLVSVTIQTNPGYVTIDADNSSYVAGGTVDIDLNRLEPGDSVTIRVVAEVQTTVSPGETIDNDAVITWTSLPGPQGTSNATPGNSGDTDGERNGTTTGENDHTTPTNTVNFTILSPEPVKSIDGTSEIGTSDAEDGSVGNERPVAIGEEVTYRLAVTLPESTSISFRLDDVLADGIEYVAGSARVSYLADTAPSFNGVFAGILNETEPSLTFPASNVSFGVTAARALSFDFGSIINNDGDAGYEYIIVEFTVVVMDDTAINNTGQIWANDFDVVIDEGLPTETITPSNSVGIIVVEPAVNIVKTFVPDEVVRGTTISMTLVVSNLAADGATGPAYDLQVTDVLDDWLNVGSNANIAVNFNAPATSFGSTFDLSNSVVTAGFATGVTDNIDVRISGLPVDGVATITVTMQVDPNADPLLLSRTITNTATVVNDTLEADVTPDDEDREYTDTATDDLNVVKPTLLVTKTDSIDPVAAGALMSYTVTIQNTGTPNFAATNVLFRDQIPTGFIVTLVVPSQGTCSPIVGGILPCSLGTIASGASANVVITGRYPATTASGTIVNNISYVSSTEGNNGNDGNDTPTDGDDERAEEPTTILREVDVSIVKIVDDSSPNEGDLITFTLNIRNNGPSQATNVIVTDSIPAGLTFVQFVPGTLPCVYAAPTLTCTFPTLNVGQTRTIGIEATVDAGTAGGAAITNTADVTTTEPETNLANNTDDAVVTVDSMDLQVVKVVDDATPSEGDTIVYTITVTNLGPAPATGVTITDDLNALVGITYVSDDSATTATTYSSATGLWTLTGITLDAGDSLSLNITATVAPGASALPQPLVNTAVLSASDQPDTNPANDSDDANVSVGGLDLSLIKGVNNPTPNEGDTIVYSIIVQNLGAANATNIVVLDQLDTIPVGYVSHVANLPGTTYNPVTGQWTIPSLLAGRSIRLDITVTVDAGTAGSTITNVASINSVDQNDANPANNSDDAVITVGSLDLAVTKTVDNATPAEGGTIVYSVTIANNGPADATGVILADALPAGVTYVSDNAATLLDSTGAATFYGAGTWLIGNLDSGDSLTLLITATVDVGTSGTTIDNIATLSAVNQPDTNPANNTDNAVIAVSGLDLQVTKTVDNATANEGDTLVYSITVENFGAANATNVEVTDDLNILPLTYVTDNALTVLDSLGAATTYNAGTGAWTIGQLDAGQSLTLQITVTVNAGTSGTTISNDAILTGVDQADSNPTNNDDDAIVTVGGVDIEVLKVVDNPAPLQGDNVTYTITVTNNGPGDATGVIISEDLPLDGVNLTYVTHNASQGTFTPGTPGSWNIGNLANGQSETLQLTVTVEIDNGQILNVASLSSVDQIDSNPTNNSDDATITLNGIDLEVVKTVDNPTPATGDTITYSIVATNNGPTTATGVNVLDILPAGISYLSDNSALLLDDLGAGTSFNPATGDWTIGQLNAGSTRTLTIQATVLINGGSVTNTAEITGNEPESDISNNIDDAVISVDSADLSLTKTISTTTPQVGDFISYTVTVSNAGPNIAYNVAATDTLPSTVAYAGVFTASQGTFNGTVWTVGTIPVNGAATLQITVQVISNVGTFVNVAEVTASDQIDPDSTPNNGDPGEDDYDESSFVFDPPFGRKVFDASGLPELEWTVIWVNPNTDPLAVTVTDQIPNGTTFIVGSLTCTSPGTVVVNTCAYDPINDEIVFTGTIFPDPGATPATINSATNRLIINYRVRVADGTTQVRNEALLDSVNGDNVSVSETWVRGSTSSPSLGGEAAIILTKYVEPAIAFPGETLTWILEVSNPSGNAATGVVVTDSIPLGLTIQTTQADAGTATVSGQDVLWNVGTVGAGQTLRLRIVTQVSPSLNAPVTNTAYVTGDNVAGMQASATAAFVAGLPNTGETAWWTWLLWTSLLLVSLSLAGLWWLRRKMA